ncbi:MAG TPA: DUF4091 domain-containing protein [Candidatus Latescibacteria bacterium]|jgi:hypothetical protein|nr:hypothetical protein [Gemmatimonadaceae bacterium]MDP6014575.1 DUF4091 domain-containing protein [Candidatus Latescibacterota bacterium]HJP30239.1 DUF4091 domain-containing protein [Candidatus Latescibacterota bacterium]
MAKKHLQTRLLSSLTKVFADEDLQAPNCRRATCLRGEVFSFQLAYRAEEIIRDLQVAVTSDLQRHIRVRTVGLAPCELPGTRFDKDVLRTTPGLYPDLLLDVGDRLPAPPGQWRSLWVTVRVPARCSPGKLDIDMALMGEAGRLGGDVFQLEVLPATLPAQKLKHTSWFHTDCIATHYGVDAWSRQHWKLTDLFVRNAVDHGINMLLTPLFTPPLDTQVGGERPTVQLVQVRRTSKERYSFDFSRLDRWVRMADAAGVSFFEMSHLFTQWGAAHCPKIVGLDRRRERQLFGWGDRAAGRGYRSFLDQFLPALVGYIDRRRLRRRCYFHVSDEPHADHFDSFGAAAAMMHQHLKGFPFIDALSNVEYYDRGLVSQPIPAIDHIEPFVERDIPDLWTYYCVSQWKGVSNRFFCMPSARNRILGSQLYRYDLAGFLHWGFNFWYTQYSTRPVDPFKVTDAGGNFPSGDAFLVYPGAEGPVDSIRGEVFREALQDQRALQLLERLQGRQKTVRLLERGLDESITMTRYPRDATWLLRMRQRCNRRIAVLRA